MSRTETLSSLRVGDCRCVRVSPDGASVLTVTVGSAPGTARAEIRDSLSGQRGWSRSLDALAEFPVEAAWGVGGDTVTLLASGAISMTDAISGEDRPIPGDLAAHSDITAMAASWDGLRLAAGTSDGSVLLWQRDTGRVRRLRGGTDRVTALAWRADGGELCVARPRSIQFWHLPAETMILSLDVGDVYPRRLTWAPDGGLVVVAGLTEVRVIDVGARSESATPLNLGGRHPAGVSFNRTGTTLLVAMADGGVELLDRQLMRPDVATASGNLPAAVTEAACLHVNETGMAAARTDADTVTLYRLGDTLLPSRERRATAAARRWASAMARTLGGDLAEAAFSPVPSVRARKSRLAWAQDGGWYLQDRQRGSVTRYDADGQPRWESPCGTGSLSACDTVVATGHDDGTITVLDADGGDDRGMIVGNGSASWSASHGLAVADPSGLDVLVYQRSSRTGQPLSDVARTVPAPDGTGAPAWSPDGRLLAAASPDAVVLWDAQTLQRVRRLSADPKPGPGAVRWSPDGGSLAATWPGSPVTIWDTRTWRPGQPLGVSGASGDQALEWSPDSRVLAFPSRGQIGAVDLWDVRQAAVMATVPAPPSGRRPVTAVSWADGGRFAVTHDDGTVVRWEFTLPRRLSQAPDTGGHPAPILAQLGAAAAAAGAAVALPLLSDLLALLLGPDAPGRDAGPLSVLDGHPGVVALRGLRWPPAAVAGLAVAVAAGLPGDEKWQPPDGAIREDLRAALTEALDGMIAVTPRPYEAPVGDLARVLDGIDDSVLVLATLLGPDAVAAEPDLLARVRGQSFGGWSLPPAQRRLLGLRSLLRGDGTSQGHGVGDARAGIARNGQLPSLLPSQLALPRSVLAAKKSRDELLFRTREGNLPVVVQPVVLLLDDTPAAFGAVGVTLRLIANLLAAVAIRRHRRCALVPLGAPRPVFLEEPADLIHVWIGGEVSRPDLGGALTVAGSALSQLSDPLGGLPRLVLLTHPYLPAPDRPGLHVIRVHYPALPAEVTGPHTHLLPPDAGPEQIGDVIAAVFADRL